MGKRQNVCDARNPHQLKILIGSRVHMRVSVKHTPTLAFLIFIHLSLYVILQRTLTQPPTRAKMVNVLRHYRYGTPIDINVERKQNIGEEL